MGIRASVCGVGEVVKGGLMALWGVIKGQHWYIAAMGNQTQQTKKEV